MGEHRLFYLSLGLIAIAAISTQTIAYYYFQNTRGPAPAPSVVPCSTVSAQCINVKTLINYGNTTVVWHNKSDVPSSWNFYQLTTHIANVTATYYGPPLNEHLVRGIDGVQQSSAYSWRLWIFCQSKTAWVFSNFGADSIRLTDKEVLAWAFESDPSQPPLANAATTDSCS